MDGADKFRYGMFAGETVDWVWYHKPSYIVWIVVHTSQKFTEAIMERTHEFVARGPNRTGLNQRLVDQFNAKHRGGPW